MEMGEWGITELIYNMKKCKSCNKIKELSDFNKNKIKPDGLQGQCRECSNNNCKYHYNNNKKDYTSRNRDTRWKKRILLGQYLSNKKCKDCGTDDIRVLEFDHLKDKKFNISGSVYKYTWKKILKEIEKCDIVCANCHRIRTYSRSVSWRGLAWILNPKRIICEDLMIK